MKKFRKKPGIHQLILPGHGRVKDHHVLRGDKWAKLCPALLEEIIEVKVEEAKPAPLPSPSLPSGFRELMPEPAPVVEPEPELVVEPEPVLVEEEVVELDVEDMMVEESQPEVKPRSRRRRRSKKSED